MERIEIPGGATYTPLSLSDIFVSAPTVSRVLLGATLPGQIVATAAMGMYVGSSARDWAARRNVRPVSFQAAFGADVFTLEAMPKLARHAEVRLLGHAMNRDYTDERVPRDDLARRVDHHLTDYIAGITGQQIVTSTQVRSFNLAKVIMPFAQGTCDVISGDVAIFRDGGLFEPHIIAHEFSHRKGYLKELHAQALAYLAMRNSDDPVLVQGARAERLSRQLAVLADDDPDRFDELLASAALRPEVFEELSCTRPSGSPEGPVSRGMRALYDKRMKLSGQNGISDYDVGFTNFLWTFSRSETASQPPQHARI